MRRRLTLPVLYAEVDAEIAAVRRRVEDEGFQVGCREGCSACCYQRVLLTDLEARGIVEHVAGERGPEALVELRARAERQLERVRAVYSHRHYYRLREPCVFLEEDRCSVYAVRPLVCRTHLILDDPRKCAGEMAEVRVVNVEDLTQRATVALQRIGAEFDVTLVSLETIQRDFTDETVARLTPSFASQILTAIDAREGGDP